MAVVLCILLWAVFVDAIFLLSSGCEITWPRQQGSNCSLRHRPGRKVTSEKKIFSLLSGTLVYCRARVVVGRIMFTFGEFC